MFPLIDTSIRSIILLKVDFYRSLFYIILRYTLCSKNVETYTYFMIATHENSQR